MSVTERESDLLARAALRVPRAVQASSMAREQHRPRSGELPAPFPKPETTRPPKAPRSPHGKRHGAGSAGDGVISGWYEFTVDHKGRVVLPAEWRYVLGTPFVLVPGPDGSLRGIRVAHWRQMVGNPLFLYHLSGSAVVNELCPASRRFTVPIGLRRHLGIRGGDPVALIGLGDSFRLLPAAKWQAEKAEIERELQEVVGC